MTEQRVCLDFVKKKKKSNKRSELIFLTAILVVPTIHWLVFWLYVNMSSFVLAFKSQAGEWSFINFEMFWSSLKSPYGDTVGRSLANTLKY